MKKMKKFLCVIIITLIINLTFVTNISNASLFGTDLTTGTENFSNRGSEQLANLGVGENILDGPLSYLSDAFLVVMLIALGTTIVVAVMIGMKRSSGVVLDAETRKKMITQLALIVAMFAIISLVVLLTDNCF